MMCTTDCEKSEITEDNFTLARFKAKPVTRHINMKCAGTMWNFFKSAQQYFTKPLITTTT